MAAVVPGAETACPEHVHVARERLAPVRELYPFEPHFHVVPGPTPAGLAQHFVDEGDEGSRETLLFVHGNPTWSFAWRRAIRELSPSYRCIAPDHIGCGLSDKPQDWGYRLTQHIENLERLVLSLDLQRITLVLHDWGGAIGMGLARRHPERIARLVLMNTAAFPSKRIPLCIAACRIPVFGSLAVRGLNAFAQAATFMAVQRPLSSEVKRGYLLPYDSWRNRIATHAFVEDIPMNERHPSWNELAAIGESLASFRDRPTLLLWGERDWCFSPSFLREFERRWPHAEVQRFPDAGHYVFEDEAEALVARIATFLQQPSSGTPR